MTPLTGFLWLRTGKSINSLHRLSDFSKQMAPTLLQKCSTSSHVVA
ncbi:hypothetical protein CJA_3667 [Cellvibrio japonicus Ueda107]|uniref:Uncharacterized protein n=1 Tax=Cellvibrio japonicus (strain Ueda107) TaxID=498211 RepID=B3PHS5_CELJU|nr:hypothetical protein CJA_3667 [Cellvibrio japonicus Ueda107]